MIQYYNWITLKATSRRSRLCRDYHACHSVQAKRDEKPSPYLIWGESSIFDQFWIPVFTGMTMLITLSVITTQFLSRNDEAMHGANTNRGC
jgi:hypothetical protein